MSSPCTTPTNSPHGDLKEHFDIFHHHSRRFISFSISRLSRPCSLSRPVQATQQSSAASCPSVAVVVVRQFDERLWERLCIEVCTPDVNDCHNVILVPSSRRSVVPSPLERPPRTPDSSSILSFEFFTRVSDDRAVSILLRHSAVVVLSRIAEHRRHLSV